jgi:indolepyruvate ferredoxin oxidoreductase, beta subunit
MLTHFDPLNIVVAGVGGQGNVLLARALGELMLAQGFHVTIGETYGAAQRGGAVMSHVRVSRTERPGPLVPEGRAHLVIALEPVEALRVLARYGNADVLVLTNTRVVLPIDGPAGYPALDVILQNLRALSAKVWTVAATDTALKLGDPVLANTVLLGALGCLGILPMDRTAFERVAIALLGETQLARTMQAWEAGASMAAPVV